MERNLRMVSTLKPISDRVVVRPKDRDKETKSGIV
jgi:co-chaperonin GroES (HSP10)